MEFVQKALNIDKGSAFRFLLVIGFSAVVFAAWLVSTPVAPTKADN